MCQKSAAMRTALLLCLLAAPAFAKMIHKPIAYELDGTKFEGVLVYDDANKKPRPGVLLVPNWLGINAANLKQAELVAGNAYVVFVADLYGKDVRPKDQSEAGKAAGAVRGDRKLMRARMNKSLEAFLANIKGVPVDTKKLAAIGFCFGGTGALELARSGANVGAVVSFHGGLSSPTPEDAKNIKAKVLALHGADDPNVPPDEVKGFEDEMRKANVDWELVSYGGAVHSFTDVDANTPGRANYDPKVAARAYERMRSFFVEAFGS
jgi:dienelactone hydrolase